MDIFGFCKNKCKHKLDTVKVSSIQPATKDKVWIQKGKNLFNPNKNLSKTIQGITFSYNGNSKTFSYSGTTTGTSFHVLLNFSDLGIGFDVLKDYYLSINTIQTDVDIALTKADICNNGIILRGGKSAKISNLDVDVPESIMIYSDSCELGKTINGSFKLMVEQNSEATNFEEYISEEIFIKNNNDVYERFTPNKKTNDNGNFTVITGTQTLTFSASEALENTWEIAYPEGFNKSNTVVIAYAVGNTGCFNTSTEQFAGVYGENNGIVGAVQGTLPRRIYLTNDCIKVACTNINTSGEITIDYKIVLMKA